MSKSVSAHKDILRNHQECSAHTDIDCNLWLSPTYNCEETLCIKPNFHSISNSIGQVLFKRADIRDIFNQTEFTVNVPKGENPRQLTLW